MRPLGSIKKLFGSPLCELLILDVKGLKKKKVILVFIENCLSSSHMYWTDCGKHPKIERAGLDGSQRVTLVDTSVAWPNGITIDYHKKKIYWADAKLDKIEVMNLDGSNRRLVLDDKLPHVFGFTVLGDRLFWTDWQRKTIETFNKETDRDRLTIMEGVPDLMGLKAVDLNLTYGKIAHSFGLELHATVNSL